ncbi:serine/threonine-protein kinase [Acinetobacter pittii]|uniref:serine/threonine-protein kinase n=1 Tax=Acinetobacter pittii TaxID=48296 RepID=UPI000A95DF32|nr:serine/threonine-protein kinase [Acinetobacter pittii]
MEIYRHSSYEFQVVKRIGGGGFGEVFEVSLPTCDFKYALKKFSPKREIAEASFLSDGELLARFSQEMRYQTNCKHKNIVSICIVHQGDTPFFVMDLADSDLSTLIKENKLSKEEKIKIIYDVMDGLEYLHNKGLYHRDIKPENILKFNGIYKISDFGLIKNSNPHKHPNDVMSAIGICLGTKRYMAPEVAEAAHYSVSSDIFALGVIISELQINELDNIANKCTAQRVTSRYQTIADIRKDISRVIK